MIYYNICCLLFQPFFGWFLQIQKNIKKIKKSVDKPESLWYTLEVPSEETRRKGQGLESKQLIVQLFI